MELLTVILIFLVGISVGSFFNVCIYRLPRDLSIVSPPSFCPNCQKPISLYDNIPIASFLILGGKCRNCASKIPLRYLLVEIAAGLSAVGLYLYYGLNMSYVIALAFLSLLLLISLTDLETGLIPDALTGLGFVLGLLGGALHPQLFDQTLWYQGLLHSALGAFAGALLLGLTALLGRWLFKKEAMGSGDIKLLMMCGAFLGLENTIAAFFLAAFLALPQALYLLVRKKSEIILYGPYLALASALLFFSGPKLFGILSHLY